MFPLVVHQDRLTPGPGESHSPRYWVCNMQRLLHLKQGGVSSLTSAHNEHRGLLSQVQARGWGDMETCWALTEARLEPLVGICPEKSQRSLKATPAPAGFTTASGWEPLGAHPQTSG